MSATTDVQTVIVRIKRGYELVGIVSIALRVARLTKSLSETERIEITGQLPGQRRTVGGGTNDESIEEGIQDIGSLMGTLCAWIRQTTRSGIDLEITISVA